MAINSLSPAFLKINYQSLYAPHSMTIPTVPVSAFSDPDISPLFTLPDSDTVSVDASVHELIDLLKPLFLPSTTFADYIVYHQPTPDDIPLPVYGATLGENGTSIFTQVAKAVQHTFSFRATDFTSYKFVTLDAPAALGWERLVDVSPDGSHQNLVDYITDLNVWIQSRGGGRPHTFLAMTTTLNEKLRRSYRMA